MARMMGLLRWVLLQTDVSYRWRGNDGPFDCRALVRRAMREEDAS